MGYNNAITKVEQENMVCSINQSLNKLMEQGEKLNLPEGYNPTKELRDAMLMLDNTKVLQTCTQASISLALRSMVTSGLSMVRKQVYAIPYGNQLQMQMSYFGTINLVERMFPGLKVFAQLVHEGDSFEIGIDMFGRSIVAKHTTSADNLDKPITHAYCNIVDIKNNTVVYCEIMTKKQIDTSWSHAKTKNVQKEYPDQMAKRTVIQRACKIFLNAHSNEVSNGQLKAYNTMVKNEYEEEDPNDLRDVTPTDTQKAIRGRSKGQTGLDALLAEEDVPANPQSATSKPEVKKEEDVAYNTATGEVVDEKAVPADDDYTDIPF